MNNNLNMKKMVVAALALSAGLVFADEPAKTETEKAPLKILMIGNSFSVQMVKHLPPVAKSLGLKADVCSLYIGGCPLSKHWKNVCAPTSTPYSVTRSVDGQLQQEFQGNIPAVLKSEQWDVVTLQQASHESWKSASYHPFGDDLVKYIREHAPQAKIVVHETWSYTPWDKRLKGWKIDQDEMYAKLHAAYGDFAKGYGFDVIPTGTAVQLVRKELPVKYAENSLGGDVVGSCSFVQRDGKWTPKGDVFHMGPDGNYLQALVWTAKLFGADVTKCTYKPAKMSEDRAAFLRKMAMKAVSVAVPSTVADLVTWDFPRTGNCHERAPDQVKAVADFVRRHAPGLRISMAGNRRPSDFKDVDIEVTQWGQTTFAGGIS